MYVPWWVIALALLGLSPVLWRIFRAVALEPLRLALFGLLALAGLMGSEVKSGEKVILVAAVVIGLAAVAAVVVLVK